MNVKKDWSLIRMRDASQLFPHLCDEVCLVNSWTRQRVSRVITVLVKGRRGLECAYGSLRRKTKELGRTWTGLSVLAFCRLKVREDGGVHIVGGARACQDPACFFEAPHEDKCDAIAILRLVSRRFIRNCSHLQWSWLKNMIDYITGSLEEVQGWGRGGGEGGG